MRTAFERVSARAIDPSLWGYHLMYRPGESNRCPGCGHSNWHIGRTMAECAFCETSLPIAASTSRAWDIDEAA